MPSPEKDFTAKYVALSIDCEQQKLIESVDMKALTTLYAGVPLMQFRLSTCGRPAAPKTGALRERDPRWTDTFYWEARNEMVASLGPGDRFVEGHRPVRPGPRSVPIIVDADHGVGERQPDGGGIRERAVGV